MTIVRGLKEFMTETEAKLQYGILSGKIDTLIAFPLSFNAAFSSILIPTVSSAKASGNFENAKKKIEFSMLISIIIGLPSTVGIIIMAKPILELLFPNQSSGEFLLQISAISITFIMLSQNINSVLHGLGKTIIPAIALTIGSITKLILNVTLVKINPKIFILGGTAGAAIATVISNITSFFIALYIMKKNINIKFGIKTIYKPIVATIMMAICLIFTYENLLGIISRQLCIIITLIVAVLVYVLLILKLKVFSESEIKMLPYGNNIFKILKILKIYKNN